DVTPVTTLTLNVDPNNAVGGTVNTTLTKTAGFSTASFNNGLVPLTFANPLASFVVNGHAAADNITFTSLADGFQAALKVNGNGPDTVNLNAPLQLGSATSNGNLAVTAGTINLGANIDTTAVVPPGSVTLTGNVNLTTDVTIKYGSAN